MTTPDDKLFRLISASRQGVLATVAKDGRPQMSNVLYVWDAAERIFEEARGEPARISVDRWIAPTAMAHRDAQ